MRPGNDGLDVMGGQVRVVSSSMSDAGDKGLSVGEGADVWVIDCQMRSCTTGMEIKDSSRVVAVKTDFVDCETGVRAYRKKWSYRFGGRGVLIDCRFESDEPYDLRVKKYSRVWLADTDAMWPDRGKERVQSFRLNLFERLGFP